ncbi:MAG: YlxR family protein [Chloroflexi bacterium]|nr:YlxR family protein [Chloroflexota bacterium]
MCGRRASKRDMIRVVAVNGTVSVDRSGKTSGRGAYLCREENGDSIGKVRGRLGHALRTNIEDSDWEGVVRSVGAVASGQD